MVELELKPGYHILGEALFPLCHMLPIPRLGDAEMRLTQWSRTGGQDREEQQLLLPAALCWAWVRVALISATNSHR